MPYCQKGTFVGLGVEALWCDSTSYSDVIPVSTTYAGQIGREFTAIGGTETSSTIPSPSTPTPSPPSTTTPSPTPPTPPTPSPVPPSHTPSPKKSVPIGAIVGGVVGGLAVITGAAVAIFFCLRNQHKHGFTPGNSQHSENQTSTPPKPNNSMYPPYNEKTQAVTQYAELQQPIHQYPMSHTVEQAQVPPQQYSQPVAQVSPVQSTTQSDEHLSDGRLSVISAISSPSSPAPAYVNTVPSVPELSEQPSHHAAPVNDRYEMQ